MIRNNATPEKVELAANNLKLLLMKHVDPVLKMNKYFKHLNVVPAVNDLDGAKVLRVYFIWARGASLDGFLEKVEHIYYVLYNSIILLYKYIS